MIKDGFTLSQIYDVVKAYQWMLIEQSKFKVFTTRAEGAGFSLTWTGEYALLKNPILGRNICPLLTDFQWLSN